MSDTKFYVDGNGNYLGGSDNKPLSEFEVSSAPDHASQKWNGSGWDDLVLTVEAKIAELESQVSNRNLRGAALGDQYAIDHIQSIEDQIEALRTV